MSEFKAPMPYNSYQARITVAAGVLNVNVFYNAVGNIAWSKQATGLWKAQLTNAFPLGKTQILPYGSDGSSANSCGSPIIEGGTGNATGILQLTWQNASLIYLSIENSYSKALADIDMQTYIELRVYP